MQRCEFCGSPAHMQRAMLMLHHKVATTSWQTADIVRSFVVAEKSIFGEAEENLHNDVMMHPNEPLLWTEAAMMGHLLNPSVMCGTCVLVGHYGKKIPAHCRFIIIGCVACRKMTKPLYPAHWDLEGRAEAKTIFNEVLEMLLEEASMRQLKGRVQAARASPEFELIMSTTVIDKEHCAHESPYILSYEHPEQSEHPQKRRVTTPPHPPPPPPPPPPPLGWITTPPPPGPRLGWITTPRPLVAPEQTKLDDATTIVLSDEEVKDMQHRVKDEQHWMKEEAAEQTPTTIVTRGEGWRQRVKLTPNRWNRRKSETILQ